MSGTAGELCLILHSHLPFVRHLEHEVSLEEGWLFAALTECYVPIMLILLRLQEQGIDPALTLSLSPPLMAMLDDVGLLVRYRRHLCQVREVADRVRTRSSTDAESATLLGRYSEELDQAEHLVFDRCEGRILDGFASLASQRRLELITCNATHGYLPLMQSDEARRAQIVVGAEAFRRRFGAPPAGMWLAECGYDEGLDRLLTDADLSYTVLDARGAGLASDAALHGVHRPLMTDAGCAIFVRDAECGARVWSRNGGYPGDPLYREYHRDLGYDLPLDELGDLAVAGVRRPIGLKLHRIGTEADLSDKRPYDALRARLRAQEHARDFIRHCRQRLAAAIPDGPVEQPMEQSMDRSKGQSAEEPAVQPADQSAEKSAERSRRDFEEPPILVAAFDTELFGHWWYEGPGFLEELLRRCSQPAADLSLATPGEILGARLPTERIRPVSSSWGEGADHRVWLNPDNHWMLPLLHRAERRMIALARARSGAQGAVKRRLDAAARELLLAQSSDWAFQIRFDPVAGYAVERFLGHLQRFRELADAVEQDPEHEASLEENAAEPALFPWLDFEVYRPSQSG